MTLARREFFGVAAGAAALASGAHSAAVALYPDRPIRLVLPFPPGGVFDIVGRPWADKVKASLGSVFVDNQPGAGGSLAAQLVAHAPADGYTIFLGASSIHLTEMILREHPLLDPIKELTPISMVAITCFAIVVNPAVPVHTLGELVEYIKANPGKMAFGSAGTGTLNHLSGELLKSLTGITDLPHVPYRGAGPAIADAIGGQIPMIIPAIAPASSACWRSPIRRGFRLRLTYRPQLNPAYRVCSRNKCWVCLLQRERQSRSSPRSTTPTIAPWRTRPIANRWWMRR
jgi:tripartite-type tricarboxylate transporter receptor subunit TctC